MGARADLCGGRSAMVVPTATASYFGMGVVQPGIISIPRIRLFQPKAITLTTSQTILALGLAERKTFSSKSRHLRHRPPSRFCRSKCPHCVAVTTETLENLVSGDGDVSTLYTHKATVSGRAHQHEVINHNAVRATGLFDHGWLLGGVWSKPV
jgi:hypothetical protein